jgi:spermidine synthase
MVDSRLEDVKNGRPEAERESKQPLRRLFAFTLFVSASLLFLVEPMFAKMVLPLAGGTPEVWVTCLVFFQVVLLAGYAWAHVVSDRISPRLQFLLQCALLVLPLILLPIHLSTKFIPPTGHNPAPWIFLLALVSVGPPFFVLSTITPLLQRWYADAKWAEKADPYPLYRASNLGSLLALLSYPFLLEPIFGLNMQSRLWAWGYGGLVALVVACSMLTSRSGRLVAKPARAAVRPATSDPRPIALKTRLRWIFLAAVPSSMLLGVTLAVTTNLPPIPLLWIVPLAIYLGTFILVFAERPPLPHRLFVERLPFLLLAALFVWLSHAGLPAVVLLGLNWVTFFVVAMVCHGELARSRPPAGQLTAFYLYLALGGVIGGLFNALVAPVVFHDVLEYPLALVLAALCRPWQAERMPKPTSRWLDLSWAAVLCLLSLALLRFVPTLGLRKEELLRLAIFLPPFFLCLSFGRRPLRFALGAAALLVGLYGYTGPFGRTLYQGRSFFGVSRVVLSKNGKQILLFHGSTIHGLEYLDPQHRDTPLGYYTHGGPIGEVFSKLEESGGKPEVGIVGLGAGSLASYAQPGQSFTFYEIDPLVVRLARDPRYFDFLRDSRGKVSVILGDGRLSLQHAAPGTYGLLVLDAFNSDAIPVHLLTRQAISLYLNKLTPTGVLAFNISNRFLNLKPVLANLAQNFGMVGWVRVDTAISSQQIANGTFPSEWVVLARRASDIPELTKDPRWQPLQSRPAVGLWTDNYSDLVTIIRWD